MPSFLSDGIEIAYEVYGEGRPILLIHGFASSGVINWVNPGWVDALQSDGWQPITIDNRGHGGGWGGGGFIPGAIAGAVIGGALAAPYYYDDSYGYYGDYYDDGPAVEVAPPGGDATGYCMQRFKSYDPASGTYLGYDGLRHPCP